MHARNWQGIGVCWALLALIGILGCQPQANRGAAGNSKKSSSDEKVVDLQGLSAEQIFERMLTAYREAKSYHDQATITLSYRQGGRVQTDDAPIAVSLVRPNRLRVKAYQVTLACDGTNLRGAIADPATQNLDGQFLNRTAPPKFALSTLLDDPLLADQLGNALVLPDAGRIPIQLAFLLSEEPIQLVDGKDTKWSMLEPATADGHSCVRLDVTGAKGKFRFWIDRQNLLLRRLEYPREALIARLAQDEAAKDVQLIANFTGASFSEEPPAKLFALEVPKGAKEVRFFVPPPQPLPTDKFGQVVDGWSLTTLDGEKLTPALVRDKLSVFLWFSNHAACESSLQQFDQVRQKYAEQDKLAFYAVATEPSSVSHQRLRSLLKSWRVDAPLVRDLAAHGRDLLAINDTPTLVVFNGQSELQLYEVGVNPQMAEELPQVLEKLLAGEDVAATILKQQDLEQQQYARRLAVASGAEPVAVVEVPNVPVAPASEPTKLKLTERWSCSTLKQPGNMSLVESTEKDSPARLLVLDEGRRLVEIDTTSGEVSRTIALDLPDGVSVQRFRTTVDRDGKRYFAAWFGLGKHVFLLDDAGKRLATYPPDDARHDGVRDVLLADLNADGQPEVYVAFLGAAGVHATNFAGERQWASRALGSVLSLAVSAPNPVGWRKLLAIGAQGQLVRFNQFGNADAPQSLGGWTLGHLEGSGETDEQRPAPLAGLGLDREGKFCLVAFNERWAEQWNYPVPEGAWRSAVEPLRPTRLLGPKQPGWLVAAVDGGLHVVSDDGNLSDYWRLGYLPTGFASLTTADGVGVLIVAREEAVQAWNVAPPKATP